MSTIGDGNVVAGGDVVINAKVVRKNVVFRRRGTILERRQLPNWRWRYSIRSVALLPVARKSPDQCECRL